MTLGVNVQTDFVTGGDVLGACNLDVGIALLGIDSKPCLSTGFANLGDCYNLILLK